MGAAKCRGTYDERKAQALAAGRVKKPPKPVHTFNPRAVFAVLLDRLGPSGRKRTQHEAFLLRQAKREAKAKALENETLDPRAPRDRMPRTEESAEVNR